MRHHFSAIAFILLTFCGTAFAAEKPCSPLVLTDITIREETNGYSIDATYPVLCHPYANVIIRNWVTDTVFSLKKLEPGHDLSDFPHKYTLNIDYAVWPAGARLASVKLDVTTYTGGAHGNHWPMTWVFDRATGNPLDLGDLFGDPETALPHISNLVRPVLQNALGDMYVPDMLDAGIDPMERNFNRFILTKEGVAFFFAPYQVGPFAAGEQAVTLPYDVIDDLLTPEIRQALDI